MRNNEYDIIIVGGAVMGAAIGHYLIKADPNLKILIVEKDSSYQLSSTILSDGNIRVQFNLEENIRMSQYGIELMDTFEEDMATANYRPNIDFRRQGNLYIVKEGAEAVAKQGLERQQRLGCQVSWLETDKIKQHYPLFGSTECAGATLGHQDGTMSPLDILLGYRNKAIEQGVKFLEAEVAQLQKDDARVTGVLLASGELIHAPIVVNAAGAWAAKLARTIGVELPVQPLKRQVYSVEIDAHFEEILPMLLLPNGQYLFHEGHNHFITGGALPNDPNTDEDFSWSKERFEEHLWEGLVNYLPDFDRLKITNGWAGLYATNTFDHNALLGEYPTMPGFFLANGFSGHGFQQCHAVGRYLAELILDNSITLDLAIFSPQRLLDNKPVFENPSLII